MGMLEERTWDLDALERRLADVLAGRDKRVLSRKGMVTAAVLIPLFSREGKAHVLLTRRSRRVEHHKGEISFPGGKLDDTDSDLLACALRETDEEVGISPGDVRIIGEMDDFYTVATNYLVVPFVGVFPFPYDLHPSLREIDEILFVPMEVFFDPASTSREIWNLGGRNTEMWFYYWEGNTIWGATARILHNFTELLNGRRTD